MTRHCCDAMDRQVNWHCDQHDDPYDCPDAFIDFEPRFQEYGLIVHDPGGHTYTCINFCPWCGQRLPESQRDRWFDELERRGLEPGDDDLPPEFRDDRWLRHSP
ncbi:DUF6980 family protein [Actinopolymorpha pittospori]